MADVRRRVTVSGRVQNVWFRDTCRAEAAARGVSGWVRNLADGQVEAAFQGSDAAVDQMVAWCRQGPPRARVEHVDVRAEDPLDEQGFRIL